MADLAFRTYYIGSGKLEVVKNLLPSTDGGTFDLQIDGSTAGTGTGVGDNGTTGEITVTAGNHTVGEVGAGVTSLSNYSSSIECRDNNGAGSVVASGSGNSLSNVPVNANDDIVCTITNKRRGTIVYQKAVTQGDPNNPNQTFTLNISLNNSVISGLGNVLPRTGPFGNEGLTSGLTYTVNELNIPAGWRLDNISCVDNVASSTFSTFAAGDTSIEVTLAPAGVVICTFTNNFDITPPTVTPPSNVLLEAPAATNPANTGTATAEDDVDPNPTVTFSDVTTPGDCAPNYTIVRTWTATDAAGNSASATQIIAVRDTTTPSLTVPADVQINDGDSTSPSNTGVATATDNADPNPAISFSDTRVEDVIYRTWIATDDCGNVVSSVQTITILGVDLEITISESADPVTAGVNGGSDNLVHTITVKNNGPSTATNIEIVFGSNTLTAPALAFQQGNHHPTIGNQWQIPNLASGGTANMTLTWDVGTAYDQANPITSDATLLSLDQTDSDSSNDSAIESTTIERDVAFTMTKSDQGATPSPGDVIVYSLSATNVGANSAALAVVIVETVPANTTFNAANSDGFWSCSNGAPAGTPCTLDVSALYVRLNPGDRVATPFAVTVDAGTTATSITNSATVVDNVSGASASASETTSVNQPPAAGADSYGATEDTTLSVDPSAGVLANDSDANGDALTAHKDSDASHGSVTLNENGSFSYAPDADYCGPDSFTYHANDGVADSNVATVSINVVCVNDPPQVTSVSPASQNVDYSDTMATVTITAVDVDDTLLSLAESSEPPLSAAGLVISGPNCTTVPNASIQDGSTCTWTYGGQVVDPASANLIVFTANDGEANGTVTGQHALTIEAEDADLWFDGNDVAYEVDSAGGTASFSLVLRAQEASPDLPAGSGGVAAGDIAKATVNVALVPVGPGSPVATTCTTTGVSGSGYAALLTVSCDFSGVPVNAYEATATISGGYYTGQASDALVVYDPSLGFTTGGGWFYWPGTQERTTFGYTMKYNKPMTNIQGNLLLIRHLPDSDEIYRLKSNALYGLALGDVGGYGWAAFSGKGTYLAPGMLEPEGNYEFSAYVEDNATPGAGADRFWLQVRDASGGDVSALSMAAGATGSAVTLAGGNIVVPHTSNGDNRLPQAAFTYRCNGLDCSFDASASFDPDGSIASYAWDLGDSATDSGSTPAHLYGAAGLYTVVLTVTDNDGATDTVSQEIYVSAATVVLHVENLSGASAIAPHNRWVATVTILVLDSGGIPVAGATVNGSWSEGGSGSCTTDSNGLCIITKGNIKSNVSSVAFTVDDVSAAGASYASGANVETSIVILQP